MENRPGPHWGGSWSADQLRCSAGLPVGQPGHWSTTLLANPSDGITWENPGPCIPTGAFADVLKLRSGFNAALSGWSRSFVAADKSMPSWVPSELRSHALFLSYAAYDAGVVLWSKQVLDADVPVRDPHDLRIWCELQHLALQSLKDTRPCEPSWHRATPPVYALGSPPKLFTSGLCQHSDFTDSYLQSAIFNVFLTAEKSGVSGWECCASGAEIINLPIYRGNPKDLIRFAVPLLDHTRSISSEETKTWLSQLENLSFLQPKYGRKAIKKAFHRVCKKIVVRAWDYLRRICRTLPPEPSSIASLADTRRALDEVIGCCDSPATKIAIPSPSTFPMDSRNQWMYQQWEQGKQLKEIFAELRKIAGEKGWDPFALGSEQAVHRAIKGFCKKHGLSMTPRKNI